MTIPYWETYNRSHNNNSSSRNNLSQSNNSNNSYDKDGEEVAVQQEHKVMVDLE